MKIILLATMLTALFIAGCVTKSTWTADEVVQWHAENALPSPEFYGPLLYRGSDEAHHYFIIRAMDDWVFMKVNKDEIEIPDERPLATSSSEYIGYYAVDPQNGFHKLEDGDS